MIAPVDHHMNPVQAFWFGFWLHFTLNNPWIAPCKRNAVP